MRIEKDLRFYFEIKSFSCETKIFVPKPIITDYGVGWVDRTRRFNLSSTQPKPDRQNSIRHWLRAVSPKLATDNQRLIADHAILLVISLWLPNPAIPAVELSSR
jgi:hypothetical protein